VIDKVSGFEYKQVIVVREDLAMSVGKLVSQACHASLEASEEAKKRDIEVWREWHREGARKVVVCVQGLEELYRVKGKAEEAGLPHALIVDRGLTEIPPNTPTALGIGPAPAKRIDPVTSHLRLLR
jgi:PTH2 family peptidyl-tRNA hydrolase